MADTFEACLAEVLRWEGGFSDEELDSGGPTNKGITLARWAGYQGIRVDPTTRPMLVASLKKISDYDVQQIYYRYYWLPIQGDALPAGIDLALYDGAVNSGPVQSVKWLQRALGVNDDGHIGPVTIDAAFGCDQAAVIADMLEQRRDMLRALKIFWKFGNGWLRRIDGIEYAALAAVEKPIVATMPGTPAPAAAAPPPPLPDPAAQSAGQARAMPPTDAGKSSAAAPVTGAVGSGGQLAVDMAGAATRARAPGGGIDPMMFLLHLVQSPTFWVCLAIFGASVYALLERIRQQRLA